MDHSVIDRLSMTLIHQAEDECAERDPGMLSSAAMVLVGDVYALMICHDDPSTYRPPAIASREQNDGLSPFIR